MAADRLQIDLSNPAVTVCRWRDLVITEWRERGSAADVKAAYDLQRRYIRETRTKLVTLTIVPGSVIRPLDTEMRKSLDEAVLEIHPHTRAAALVLPATGFGGAIVRSVLTSLNFLRRLDFPYKILATVPAACAYLAPHIDGAPTAAAVEAVHNDLQAATPRLTA